LAVLVGHEEEHPAYKKKLSDGVLVWLSLDQDAYNLGTVWPMPTCHLLPH